MVDEDGVAGAVEATRKRLGGLTGLVASHGTRGVFKPAVEMTADDVRSQFNIHAIGSFVVAREFARTSEGSPGSIVFLSSTTAYGGWANQVDYGLAKAAISQLTKNLAIEWASRKIRVNAVAPGHTLTPMVESMVTDGHVLSEIEKRMPLGRLAQPEEIARTIVHLLDDATFVTGQCVAVDGGWTSVGK
jgi:NAD(P)-dependent dehydrogenase (short-subunit alcohol dehydrogenase family)